MTRRKKNNPNQIDFFNQLTSSDEIKIPNEPTGTMNSNLIKIALSEAIKKSCLERFEICKRISSLAGRKITVGMLNAYTSQSRTTHNIPCDLLIPITFVLGARKHNYYEPLRTTTIVDDNGVKAIRSSGVDGREIFSREYIKIDPTKNYRVRCKIKATGVNKRNYSLIVAYDINKTYLSNSNYNAGWRATGDYFYYSYSNPTPNNWTEYQQLFGPAFEAKLPAGTEYIKLGWLTNYQGYGTGDTLIKDLELIEVDPRSFLALRKNGSILSQKILGANQSAGARSATNIYPASSTSNSITIAPFSAQFDFGKIYYNGGRITGLSPSTKYHIYCDDNKMIGGSVIWKATKNIQEACNRSVRLKLLTFSTRPLTTFGGKITGRSYGVSTDRAARFNITNLEPIHYCF